MAAEWGGRNERPMTSSQVMKELCICFLLSLALGVMIGFGWGVRWNEEHAPTTAPVEKITEDDPRWDCLSMGNHLCGPVPPANETAEVTCDTFETQEVICVDALTGRRWVPLPEQYTNEDKQ